MPNSESSKLDADRADGPDARDVAHESIDVDDVVVRGKRPWSSRAAFDDEQLRTMAPGVWPGAEGLSVAAWWIVPLLAVAIMGPGIWVMLAAAGMIAPNPQVTMAATVSIVLAILVGSPVVVWLIARGVPKVEGRVVEARGRLCPRCAHSVAGRLPEDRRTPLACPECGEEVSSRDAVLFWLRQVRRAHDP